MESPVPITCRQWKGTATITLRTHRSGACSPSGTSRACARPYTAAGSSDMDVKPPWWQSRTWRLIQTNLREIDMLDIRAEQVVADLQAFKANVVMINAAGIIASYPTKLPFHYQSPYLKGDSLQTILAACHQAGIRAFARTDFSKVRRPVYEAHPAWATVTASGKVIDYNGDVQACINGDYKQKYMLLILEER